MNVCLTESGAAYAKQLLAPVYRAGDEAMAIVIGCTHEHFVAAAEHYAECLQNIFDRQKSAHENSFAPDQMIFQTFGGKSNSAYQQANTR